MDNTSNALGELIRRAKGKDRSMREYARASGVDPAILSRIMNGIYVPKKPDIFKKITSKEASPRDGVTYNDFVRVINPKPEYESSRMFAMAAAAGILPSIAVTSAILPSVIPVAGIIASSTLLSGMAINNIYNRIIDDSDENDGASNNNEGNIQEADPEIREYLIKKGRFSKYVNGILYGELASKEVLFQLGEMPEELEDGFNVCICLNGGEYSEILLLYAFLTEEQKKIPFFVEGVGKRLVEKSVLLKKNEKRKVIIVTNSDEVFQELLGLRGSSIDLNLAAMYADDQEMSISKKGWIARYDKKSIEDDSGIWP